MKLVPEQCPLPLKAKDDVRVTSTLEHGRYRSVYLDYGSRSSSSHCLVALPAVPLSAPDRPTWLRFSTKYIENLAPTPPSPFIAFVSYFEKGQEVGEEKIRFFSSEESTDICLSVNPPMVTDTLQVVIYADRRAQGVLSILDPHVVSGPAVRHVTAGAGATELIDRTKAWRQEGRRLICTSFFGEHYAIMPEGWLLENVHPAALAAAEWFLFNNLEARFFGERPSPKVAGGFGPRPTGSKTGLSFSLGTDSVAAATLLPASVEKYYCRRDYDSYRLPNGAVANLPSHEPYEKRLSQVPRLIQIPNNFEQISLRAGKRHGYEHGYGYAAIGLLLADHLDLGDIAFGSVMEQVFLRSGYQYSDVIANKSSLYNGVRAALGFGGLHMVLPTASCSEVLTTRLADAGPLSGLSVSCPNPDSVGNPCGSCFKCFRKLRISGVSQPPPPGEAVLRTLSNRPLKSATSVVYACQVSGDFPAEIAEYKEVELGFLRHFYAYGLQEMVPEHLQAHALSVFRSLGIRPMNAEDELSLRSLAEVFLS